MGTEGERKQCLQSAHGMLSLGSLLFVYRTSLRRLIFSHHVADEENEDQKGCINSLKVPQLLRDRAKT